LRLGIQQNRNTVCQSYFQWRIRWTCLIFTKLHQLDWQMYVYSCQANLPPTIVRKIGLQCNYSNNVVCFPFRYRNSGSRKEWGRIRKVTHCKLAYDQDLRIYSSSRFRVIHFRACWNMLWYPVRFIPPCEKCERNVYYNCTERILRHSCIHCLLIHIDQKQGIALKVASEAASVGGSSPARPCQEGGGGWDTSRASWAWGKFSDILICGTFHANWIPEFDPKKHKQNLFNLL
jgi:hypothetical protein